MNSETIRRQALSLPVQERAELAEQLLSSLDALPEAEVEQLWFREAARVEHLEHVACYEEPRHGLGARYLAAFEAAMLKVCAVIGVRRQFRFGAKRRTLRASLWLSEFGL